jgi:hypothetical protein
MGTVSYHLDDFDNFGTNVGLRCRQNAESVCVQVDIDPDTGKHDKIVFGVKDGNDGCKDPSNGWMCSGKGNDNCACNRRKDVCIKEGPTSCILTTAPATSATV